MAYNVTITTNALDNIITRFTTPTLILQINAKDLDLTQVRALSVNISQGRLKVKKVFPDEVEIKENGIYTTLSHEEQAERQRSNTSRRQELCGFRGCPHNQLRVEEHYRHAVSTYLRITKGETKWQTTNV